MIEIERSVAAGIIIGSAVAVVFWAAVIALVLLIL
jgi:hypothetical protein